MTRPPLTPARRAVYDALCRLWETEGRVTYRRLAAASGRNLATTQRHVVRLVADGYVLTDSGGVGQTRTATLRPASHRPVRYVPVLTAAEVRARFNP